MGSPSEDDSDDELWDQFHTWDDFKNMGTDAAPRTVMSTIEEPDVALRGMKAAGIAGKNLAIMAGWHPRIRGVRHEVKCPSGRRIEYQMFGRCSKEDPVVLMFPGMFNANASRALAHCCGRYELPEEPDGFPQSAALLFNRLTDGDDPRAEFDSLPLTFACVARPGYGKSTLDVFPWNFTYEMFAADMAAVADWLGAPRFAVMGASSGGPCALAVAHAFPRRVTACLVNCGDSNYRRGYPRNAHWFHGEATPATGYRAGIEWTAKIWLGVTCGYRTLTPGWVADMWMEGLPAAWHDGLESIACPVLLYHGERDALTDPNCSRYHAARLRNAHLRVVRGAGHTEFPAATFDAMVLDLRARALSNGA